MIYKTDQTEYHTFWNKSEESHYFVRRGCHFETYGQKMKKKLLLSEDNTFIFICVSASIPMALSLNSCRWHSLSEDHLLEASLTFVKVSGPLSLLLHALPGIFLQYLTTQ